MNPLRFRSLAALLIVGTCTSALGAAQMAEAVYSDQGPTAQTPWVSSRTTPLTRSSSTPVLGFTVGGTTYTTGVNDALMASVTATAANFQAFKPTSITSSGPDTPLIGQWARTSPPRPLTPISPLMSYLTDGTNGLELATALFNAPAQVLTFSAAVPSVQDADLQLPFILATQVGAPGNNDVYFFKDTNGNTVGSAVDVTYTGLGIGNIKWDIYRNNGNAWSINTDRTIRMVVLSLADFGFTPQNKAQLSSITSFVQKLNGDSDVAFIAYNTKLLAADAADMAVHDLTLPSGTVGTAYTGGSFVCTNQGPLDATAATCTLTGLPNGLSYSCPVIPVPFAKAVSVTCTISGTPTAAGTSTVTATTGATNDNYAANNSVPGDLVINAAPPQPPNGGAATHVPTLAQWALLLLAGLLAAFGIRMTRHRG